MKLLGWMHRKFRQNSGGGTGCGDPFREFIAGHACNCLSGRTSLDDSYLQHPRHSKHPIRPVHDQWLILPDGDTVHNIDYFPPPAGDPDEDYNDEDAPTAAELFHGLLAIGTLGSGDADSMGSVTPTFGGPTLAHQPLQIQSVVEAIADKEEKEVATEADLMLINAELEKVLFAMEAKEVDAISTDQTDDDDLNRLSCVSAKQLVVVTPEYGTVGSAPSATCPLQEYLLGSTVGMEQTVARAAGRERKDFERRTSLGELFLKTRAIEGGAADGTGGRPREKANKPDDKTAVAKVQLLVKKMLMRRRSGKASDDDADKGPPGHAITSSDNKFHKILQMFHRKVHPENLVAAKKAIKLSAEKAKNKPQHVHGGGTDSCYAGGGLGNNSKSIKKGVAQEKDLSTCLNCSMTLDACVGGRSANSSGNREHWIKTDADFLVLEL